LFVAEGGKPGEAAPVDFGTNDVTTANNHDRAHETHPHCPHGVTWGLKRIRLFCAQPTTNNQQPTTNNQQPTTNNQQPTTNMPSPHSNKPQ
jgi:hypothetical protein